MLSGWLTLIWMIVNFDGQSGTISSMANVFKYEPDWVSLDRRPLPQWYDEAKVGIFIHWGVYSVPSMGSEWFWNNWKNLEVKKYVDFMDTNYKKEFTYQEFAHEFTAELFNATQWALLFKDSGAKYVVLTSKHHDGYCLWPSEYSFGWNSMDVGPKRDIIRELSDAVRDYTNLKFGLYYSLFEWFNRMYVQDKRNLFLTHNYVTNKVRPEQTYLVNEYRPEIIWSDGDWEASSDYWQSKEFLAWLYNDSPVRDTVVVNDRWGFGTSCLHGDFYNCEDRYNPGIVIHHKWENAFTIDKSSWGQRYDVTLNSFLTIEEIIAKLVTTISCNGNILINIGPTKYGTIAPIFEERLRQMGDWLRRNAEAIYNTIPWLQQNDTTPDVWYTCSKDENTQYVNIYAIVLNYPYQTNAIDIHPFENLSRLPKIVGLQSTEHLTSNTFSNVQNITLLGMPNTTIMWHFNDSTVHIEFPPKHLSDGKGLRYAWTFKITVLL